MNAPLQTGNKIPLTFAIALFLLWITPGLMGRDLWKADEPYSFGMGTMETSVAGKWRGDDLNGFEHACTIKG